MKKIVTLLTLIIVMRCMADAQVYDTVSGPGGRLPGYHYSWWYDTCDFYFDTIYNREGGRGFFDGALHEDYRMNELTSLSQEIILIKSEFVSHPSALTGIGVWQMDETVCRYFRPWHNVLNGPRVPEYIYVFQYDSRNDTIHLIDSVQWDTAAPRILKVPTNVDTATYGFRYFYLYEAHLDKPILVDSTFFLGGTFHNNILSHFDFPRKPTIYGFLMPHTDDRCLSDQEMYYFRPAISQWIRDGGIKNTQFHGAYLPMIEYAHLRAVPADSAMGTAGPDEERSKYVNHAIYARPNRGYRFSHWNDGSTANPRNIELTQDTTFTAYFIEGMPCYANIFSDDEEQGAVAGGGTYYDGDTVTITAMPRGAYRFDRWDDGDTANPRRFVITQDTSFTAFFAPRHTQGIDTLADAAGGYTVVPNPADDAVTVEGPAPVAEVAVYDMGGRQVALHRSATFGVADLPAGAYLLRITARDGTTARLKLVKR